MPRRYGLLAEPVAAPGEGDALTAFLARARETAAGKKARSPGTRSSSATRHTADSTHLPAKMIRIRIKY